MLGCRTFFYETIYWGDWAEEGDIDNEKCIFFLYTHALKNERLQREQIIL